MLPRITQLYFAASIVLVFSLFKPAGALIRFVAAAVWQSIARLSMKNGEKALAAYTAGTGAFGHIWDMVGSCSTANGEPISSWDCAESVISSTFAVGFTLAYRYFTGAWWKRGSELPPAVAAEMYNSIAQLHANVNTTDLYVDSQFFAALGVFNETHEITSYRNTEYPIRPSLGLRKREFDEWPLHFTHVSSHKDLQALIHVKTNITHAVIYPLIQSNATTNKRDGYNGYDEPNGELFLQSYSEGTIANWDDVENWEHWNNDAEVWHEWDTMLEDHNWSVWMGVGKGCVCAHNPAPTQATGCWAAFHRAETGYDSQQDFDDGQWCAQNYNNLCQCD
ncbi:LAME_0C09626g1_1 [Lachancea meyersii CBS 8951]|uniref:LAME_0C09626g1_1 n=1 Tax=Lachancea meyersii CBS 8951 TaxID=1266667 RepID=A0A1G4J412_9SACH|nr:LAME_0C09626g1_1 [Lachancea meyersii CBS 8951]